MNKEKAKEAGRMLKFALFSVSAGLIEMGARLLFAGLLAPRLGVWGIWLATPLSWAAGCIIPVARYYSGEWMKKALL